MILNMTDIQHDYENSRGRREIGKYIFSIATMGLGALYLWATTSIIREGEIGLRRTATGKMVLLPPGRHSNFPWENYPVEPQSLSDKTIKMGPYQIITADTGYVAKTFNKGKLEILKEGQHIITDASHTFQEFISTKQETKKLHEVIASTSDNVGLRLHADVRYQIEEPEKAVAQIDDIENSIKEIAEISISRTVSNHKMSDFAPATSTANFTEAPNNNGISSVIVELGKLITDQLTKLGIKLINIGITSWRVNDTNLAHELAQGAVVLSQTQSQVAAAKLSAEVTAIKTDAESKAVIMRANAEAEAIEAIGNANLKVADAMKDNPVSLRVYELAKQSDMIRYSTSPHVFFSASNTASQPPIVATIPLRAS